MHTRVGLRTICEPFEAGWQKEPRDSEWESLHKTPNHSPQSWERSPLVVTKSYEESTVEVNSKRLYLRRHSEARAHQVGKTTGLLRGVGVVCPSARLVSRHSGAANNELRAR